MIATRYWLPVLVLGSFIACNAVPEGEDDDGDGGSDSDDDDDDEDGPPKTSTGSKFTGGSETGGSETGGSETGGSETGGSMTGPSPVGGSETGGNCDMGSCDSCVPCASESVCAQQTQACNSEPQCAPVYECVQACQDDACLQNCQAQYPQGYDALFNLLSCLYCQGCYQTCDGASVCG